MKTLLLILLILPAAVSYINPYMHNHFDFETTLVCRDRVTHAPLDHWCYTLEILERQLGVFITSGNETCVDEMMESVSLNRDYTWISKGINRSYLFSSKVTHNCTIDGQPIIRERYISYAPPVEGYSQMIENVTERKTFRNFTFTLGIDLFDDGTEVVEYEKNKKTNPLDAYEDPNWPTLDINF
ncbi:hypothetical protein CAEBREN_13518 [Caenorhabditis brenneri]|uniref:Uncharacterized protein n=1 Tax=Caenorhabditis brenneri TaxID=135651 RepID=G0PHI8_CAEBE|nr:hypothetical protein CAEBREN_13518 [Caenorhabditis brenneri]